MNAMLNKPLLILVAALIFESCKENNTITPKEDDGIEFVEIFTDGSPDSVTQYNQNICVGAFIHFDYKTDSIYFNSRQDSGFGKAKLTRQSLIDSLKNFVGMIDLKKPDSFYSNYSFELKKMYDYDQLSEYEQEYSTGYCGPPSMNFIIQKNGIKKYYHIYYINDDYYNEIYKLLEYAPFDNIENISQFPFEFDYERTAVELWKKTGVYEFRYIPYFPNIKDDNQFNPQSIIGSWRFVASNGGYNEPDRYSITTFLPNGHYYSQRFNEGKSSVALNTYDYKYKINTANKTIEFSGPKFRGTFKIKTMNDSTIVWENEERKEYLVKDNRHVLKKSWFLD